MTSPTVACAPAVTTTRPCHTHPADWWFPEPGDELTAARAIRLCATCPVATQCLALALLGGEQHGIWGGVNFERARGRRRRPIRYCERCHTIPVYGSGAHFCDQCRTPAQRARKRANDRRRLEARAS